MTGREKQSLKISLNYFFGIFVKTNFKSDG